MPFVESIDKSGLLGEKALKISTEKVFRSHLEILSYYLLFSE